MTFRRRKFLQGAAALVSGAGTLAAATVDAADGKEVPADDRQTFFKVYPIGKVVKKDKTARLELLDQYADGLKGLADWSHVNVFYWFDRNDTPTKRAVLQVHPRGDKKNPLTGVFACRAPVRPNLIALSVCKIVSVEGNLVHVDGIDAFDGTPILDLKPHIPPDSPAGLKVPDWARRGPAKGS